MSFFWPSRLKENSTVAVRIARVIHWGSVVLSVGAFVAGAMSIASFIVAQRPAAQAMPDMLIRAGFGLAIVLVGVVVICLTGRALRYIIGGE